MRFQAFSCVSMRFHAFLVRMRSFCEKLIFPCIFVESALNIYVITAKPDQLDPSNPDHNPPTPHHLLFKPPKSHLPYYSSSWASPHFKTFWLFCGFALMVINCLDVSEISHANYFHKRPNAHLTHRICGRWNPIRSSPTTLSSIFLLQHFVKIVRAIYAFPFIIKISFFFLSLF